MRQSERSDRRATVSSNASRIAGSASCPPSRYSIMDARNWDSIPIATEASSRNAPLARAAVRNPRKAGSDIRRAVSVIEGSIRYDESRSNRAGKRESVVGPCEESHQLSHLRSIRKRCGEHRRTENRVRISRCLNRREEVAHLFEVRLARGQSPKGVASLMVKPTGRFV